MTARVTQLFSEASGIAGAKTYRASQIYIEVPGTEAVRAFFLFPNIEWIKGDQLKQAYVVFTAYETLSEDLYLRLAFANTSTPTAPASADELRSIETT